MLISSGTLVSDCHKAIIYMQGDEYHCTQCVKPCKSAGTLADLHAPQVERARLEQEVVKHAKGWRQAILNSSRDLIKAVDALEDFESQQGIQKG